MLDLLDATEGETVGTSVRLPVALRDAAVVAAEMGLAGSTTELTARGLRDLLEAFVQRAVLDAHYEVHPEARPDLAEIALADAQLDRCAPGAAVINRLRVVDAPLDRPAADRAVGVRDALGVSVVDAHLVTVIASNAGLAAVLTSDVADVPGSPAILTPT
ncbi:MAG: hypothetical protein LC799_12995 [Actinobacteria bacterium]|nr:hypothetical protein [Actinomycetota bacterium]